MMHSDVVASIQCNSDCADQTCASRHPTIFGVQSSAFWFVCLLVWQVRVRRPASEAVQFACLFFLRHFAMWARAFSFARRWKKKAAEQTSRWEKGNIKNLEPECTQIATILLNPMNMASSAGAAWCSVWGCQLQRPLARWHADLTIRPSFWLSC
jgi:hypothetical protein